MQFPLNQHYIGNVLTDIQSTFYGWRGEWVLVTVLIVGAPTFGGNYINSVWRIVGEYCVGYLLIDYV